MAGIPDATGTAGAARTARAMPWPLGVAAAAAFLLTGACSPTVRVEAPDKPIEINLNIRIEQEVRLKVEGDLEEAFQDDPDLFAFPLE